jgi:aliphatic nitrilase
MIWGQGDGSGFRTVNTAVGRVGALACWEHYNPLARFALMEGREEIHCAQFPGSMVGQIFADQIAATIRHHALESGCFVINSTGWLTDDQIASITSDTKLQGALRGGCYSVIISPEGAPLCDPITEGEGMAIAELDPSLVTKRKRMLDSVGHYARPDIFSLLIDSEPRVNVRSKPRSSGESRLDHGAVNSDSTNCDDAGFPNNAAHEEAVPTL